MPWLSQFKFGRPGYEYLFDLNPEGLMIDEGPIDVIARNVAGDLKRSIIKASAPTIKVNSSYLQKAQRDQFASLASMADSHLSFQTRDDWQKLLERNLPLTTITVPIQNTSATRLDQALVAGGFSSQITINGVFIVADGSGTNYFTGGSYASATRVITLGTTLPNAVQPVYVTYTYKGWLVVMRKLSHRIQGGWIDRFQYDFQLEGA